MLRTEWEYSSVGKPKHDGIVACLLDDGTACFAQWCENIGMWYDAQTKETFGNVVRWFDIKLPDGFVLSPIYDEVVNLR